MNYPVWQLDFAGGGLIIAMIAVIHVYVAHFAVGGGLFLVLAERKGLRENSPAIIEYVRQHARFFMLLTMVFGSLTGVGIWYTISLLNPAATSLLIHNFVFAWGTEWVFFVGEIVSLFIYYYTFGRLSDRDHLLMGWIYFACAWMSLFIINGIIDFMLTPGSWVETGGFWVAFFNPTFWPALFFRTFLALIITGLFGFVTASFQKDQDLRLAMLRFCAKWLVIPFVFFLASAWWYRAALPPHVEEMIFQRLPGMQNFFVLFAACSSLIIIGGLIMAIRMPARVNRGIALVMLIIGLATIGSFEFIRELGRKPFIINDYMYSNSILKKDMPRVAAHGVLMEAKWAQHRRITDENRYAAGREIFTLLCQSCHSLGGPMNDIAEQTGRVSKKEIDLTFVNMGERLPYMPPFVGNEQEKAALVEFLYSR